MIPLGRPFGFPLTLDPTALFILALIALPAAQGGAGGLFFGLLMAVLMFGSILVHELGHAFTARSAGLGPVAIVLHGFGGLTSFGKSPKPGQGIWITLAGPGASLLLGLVFIPLALLPGMPGRVGDVLVYTNLFWGAFNLLPMFPLDGGMILYHGLALRLERNTAAMWAARVGVVVAVVVAVGGWMTSQYFILIIAGLALFRSFPIAFGGR